MNIQQIIEYVKTGCAVAAIVFAAGIMYSKFNVTIDETDRNTKELEQIKFNQIRMADSSERLEKSQREVSEKMLSVIEKMSERQAKIEERVIITEMKIKQLESKSGI